MRGYLLLGLAIATEVVGTTFLKVSEGFSLLLPSLVVIVAFVFSFYFLGLALHYLPLSTAYAIWGGLGTALTAVVGVFVFDEAVTILKSLALLLIIGGVVLLNKSRRENNLVEAVE